ncbi:hypothetical protein GLA29479_3840 [Lysobacter antibioticus]|nr:hypothetical protein GLA29479_3840 [Lysobacter antibioticus]
MTSTIRYVCVWFVAQRPYHRAWKLGQRPQTDFREPGRRRSRNRPIHAVPGRPSSRNPAPSAVMA